MGAENQPEEPKKRTDEGDQNAGSNKPPEAVTKEADTGSKSFNGECR